MSEFTGPARWSGRSGKRAVRAVGTPAAAAPPTRIDAATDTGPDATDAAKALAAQYGIDLATVTGTGAEGRITKDDVQALVEPEPAPEPSPDEPDDQQTLDPPEQSE